MTVLFCLCILFSLMAAVVLVASTNPSHYGAPSTVGGQCQSDEESFFFNDCATAYPDETCDFCAPECDQTSDCPTDTPSGTGSATHYCLSSGSCVLTCSNDNECQPGAWCWAGNGHSFCVYSPSKDCYYVESVEGSWVRIGSSSGDQQVSYEVGVTTSSTVTDTWTWGASLTASVEAGFDIGVASAKVTVGGTASTSMSTSYSSTFSTTSTTKFSYSFGPGVVWQWTFDFSTGCGTATATGHDLMLTSNAVTGPCCLPGMFIDITNPYGQCIDGTPDMCEREASTTMATTSTAPLHAQDEDTTTTMDGGLIGGIVVAAAVVLAVVVAVPIVVMTRARSKHSRATTALSNEVLVEVNTPDTGA